MFKGLKISIAIIICVAFLFRLFSLNLSFVSFSDKSNTLAGACLTSVTKQGIVHVAPLNSKPVYTDVVFSEEDPDDENEHKSFTPVLLESFSGLTICSIGSHVKAITPSNKHFACNSS